MRDLEFDAFTGGVEPGGLRSKKEIKILICYLLTSVNAPLSHDLIVRVMQENGLANYFEVVDVFSSLLEKGTIAVAEKEPELCYIPTEKAQVVSKQLDVTLPASVRERAVKSALSLLAEAKRERENKVEIKEIENGYQVTCHVSGGDLDLMTFSLYVPDLHQARLVRRNFHHNPEIVYRAMLALVTGNHDLVAEILKDLAPSGQ